MKKQNLKYKIAANIIILISVLILTVSLSFAWFTADNELNVNQEIVMGKFSLELNKNSDLTDYEGKDIFLQNTYPMTRNQAENSADNAFLFNIINSGNISAMFRFRISVLENGSEANSLTVNGADLTQYFRFSAWTKSEENSSFVFATEGNLADFVSAMDTITCENNSYTSYGLVNGRRTVNEVNIPGEQRFLKLYIWLDENTVLGDGGADSISGFGNETIIYAFKMHVQAMQSTGTLWS